MSLLGALNAWIENRDEERHDDNLKYESTVEQFRNNGAHEYREYFFDMKAGKILLGRHSGRAWTIISFSDIDQYHVNEQEHEESDSSTSNSTVRKRPHAIGRTVVGHMVAGDRGALVGFASGKVKTDSDTNHHSSDKLVIDNLEIVLIMKGGQTHTIHLIDYSESTRRRSCQNALKEVQVMTALLDQAIEKNHAKLTDDKSGKTGKGEVESSNDGADPYQQIKELKGLLDMGAITQDEYNQKKKQLLGL